jgi:hypothetical protein
MRKDPATWGALESLSMLAAGYMTTGSQRAASPSAVFSEKTKAARSRRPSSEEDRKGNASQTKRKTTAELASSGSHQVVERRIHERSGSSGDQFQGFGTGPSSLPYRKTIKTDDDRLSEERAGCRDVKHEDGMSEGSKVRPI